MPLFIGGIMASELDYDQSNFVKTHMPCPECGSSDAVSINSDGTWKCFSVVVTTLFLSSTIARSTCMVLISSACNFILSRIDFLSIIDIKVLKTEDKVVCFAQPSF